MVSHHVPVGSRPRAEGSNRDSSAAANGVQGQYFFVNLAGAFAFVVLQEWHRPCIGILSINIWSNHLMIGLCPAQMAVAIVHLSPVKLATCIGVGFSNRADRGWFPITFPWGPIHGPRVRTVILVPWPTASRAIFLHQFGRCVCLCSIAGMAQTVHWDILHKRLERPPNDWPASCSDGLVCSGGHCFIEE